MSDLISRSAAIEQMWWLYNNYVNNANNFEQEETEAINRAFSRLQKVIEELPTAYDVDKVVAEITSSAFWNAGVLDLDVTERIVRKGGVNG